MTKQEMDFTKRLKLLRCYRELSIRQLAKLCGYSHQTIFKWEHGQLYPCTQQVVKLCEVLDIPFGYFNSQFSGSDVKKLKVVEKYLRGRA